MDFHIKDVLKKFVKRKEISDGYNHQRIVSFWSSKMSPSISSRTSDIRFEDGHLRIKVSSAALRNELFNNREKIIQMMNTHLEDEIIVKITFS